MRDESVRTLRMLRVRVFEPMQADLDKLKRLIGVQNESDLVRTALREMATRREKEVA